MGSWAGGRFAWRIVCRGEMDTLHEKVHELREAVFNCVVNLTVYFVILLGLQKLI